MTSADEAPSSSDDNEFMTVAEAATLLFVSRPHVMKLLEQGTLKRHLRPGNELFVDRKSALQYQAACESAQRAYNASTDDD
ncbi:excisionase family DNA-binding protein [Burkholderia sp. 22PA0099]|uniref:excisionase family DNA-binding protein n=1 Tax=Burkholderia sp. 22PA0099 TaxID=3237372 RepID=UPI0039C2D282